MPSYDELKRQMHESRKESLEAKVNRLEDDIKHLVLDRKATVDSLCRLWELVNSLQSLVVLLGFGGVVSGLLLAGAIVFALGR